MDSSPHCLSFRAVSILYPIGRVDHMPYETLRDPMAGLGFSLQESEQLRKLLLLTTAIFLSQHSMRCVVQNAADKLIQDDCRSQET